MGESSRDKLCFNINGIIYWIDKEAYELEQRYLNDIKFRQEMEEKYKGQYKSPIVSPDNYLLLTKDKDGYFERLQSLT